MPLSSYAKGAQKAYKRMVKRYGVKEGRRIFFARADERGRGKTVKARVNSVYKKGAKLRKRR